VGPEYFHTCFVRQCAGDKAFATPFHFTLHDLVWAFQLSPIWRDAVNIWSRPASQLGATQILLSTSTTRVLIEP